jgi:hypothetical protein
VRGRLLRRLLNNSGPPIRPLACSIRQPAECSFARERNLKQPREGREPQEIRGKLPRTTGWQPIVFGKLAAASLALLDCYRNVICTLGVELV